MSKVDRVIAIGAFLLVWLAVLFGVSLCWVGAEFVFEGVVHTSNVDTVVAANLSFLICRELWRIDRKRGADHA